MVLGTYLEKNSPSSNGHILVLGGSKRLPRWFGALITYRRTIQVQMDPKKSAPECPVECVGGPIAFWAMPKCRFYLIQLHDKMNLNPDKIQVSGKCIYLSRTRHFEENNQVFSCQNIYFSTGINHKVIIYCSMRIQ